MTKTYTLALKLWSVHPKDLDAAGYIHKNHGGNYDNPRAAWYADQIQEYVNAAVAAVLEKAANVAYEEIDEHMRVFADPEKCVAECTKKLILKIKPSATNALAERDAKVRADALREAVEIAIDERNKRGADKSTNGLWTAITRIQALIEGEA